MFRMRPHDRRLVALLALFVAVPFSSALAQTAANYPSRQIRIICPYAPGGPTDLLARIIGQKLGELWGKPVVVENRAGLGGTLGIDAGVKSPADGYTIVIGGLSNLSLAPHLYAKLPYDPLRDLAPIASVAVTPYVLAVNPRVPARSVEELIKIARSKRDALNYGSSGAGSMSHLATEMFKAAVGADIVHVPYKGAVPAVTAIISGEIDMLFVDLLVGKPNAEAGKLRLLATTSGRRAAALPQLPTMAEAGVKDVVVEGRFGFVAPAGTPKDIVAKLNAGIISSLKMPDVIQRFNDLGYEALGDTPEKFAETLKSDYEHYGRVLRKAGIKAEL